MLQYYAYRLVGKSISLDIQSTVIQFKNMNTAIRCNCADWKIKCCLFAHHEYEPHLLLYDSSLLYSGCNDLQILKTRYTIILRTDQLRCSVAARISPRIHSVMKQNYRSVIDQSDRRMKTDRSGQRVH